MIMENVFEILKQKWEEARAPLETELNSIKDQEGDLKIQHDAQIRQKGAQARVCESKALELEAGGKFAEADAARDEKARIEASIVELSRDYEKKLIPLEERRIALGEELKELPRKVLDREFPEMQTEAHRVFEAGLVGFEEILSSIRGFEKMTGAKFDDRYLKRLQIYDHVLFNESREIWKRLRRFIGTPIAWG
jgi:hypothetical protein